MTWQVPLLKGKPEFPPLAVTNPIFAFLLPFGSDGVWQQHVAWVDATNLAGGAAATMGGSVCNSVSQEACSGSQMAKAWQRHGECMSTSW